MALATAFAFGCTEEDDDGGFDNSYENHVELTCNGSVLVDETFTSREACESFRDSNTFMCGGVELSVSC
jgi:hypothetical protein